MGKKEKLIKRLKSKPKDFTFDEAEALLTLLGFTRHNSGKTSGSRIRYRLDGTPLFLHRPHPGNELKPYQISDILDILGKAGLI